MKEGDRSAAERIAQLLDGTLAPDARARAVAEVAASEEQAAVLAESAAILRELAAEGSVGVAPARLPAPERGARLAGRPIVGWLAAASVLVAVGGWWWRARGPADDGEALRARVVVALAAPPAGDRGVGPDPSAALFAVARGAGPELSPAARATRLGVALADLQLRVARADPTADEAARRAAALLADVPGTGPVVALLDEVRRAAGGPVAATAEPLAAARAAAASATDSTRVALAEWGQLARHASARRDAAFVGGAYTARALAHAATALPAGDPARAALDAVGAGPAAAPVSDWAAFTARVEAFLRQLDGGGAG